MNEALLHEQVTRYLKAQYPHAIFRTDFAAGIKLTQGQAARHSKLQSGRSFPDIFIYEARKGYHGLGLELKREGTIIWKRDGTLTANAHIREQMLLIGELAMRGYCAQMVAGFEAAKRALDHYLGERR